MHAEVDARTHHAARPGYVGRDAEVASAREMRPPMQLFEVARVAAALAIERARGIDLPF